MTIQLNPTQHAVLSHAAQNSKGKITWFPDHIKGGARQKVLSGLFNRALITPLGSDWLVAAEGYDALGCARPTVCSIAPDPELEAAVAQAEATWTQDAVADQSRLSVQPDRPDRPDQHDSATGGDDCLAGTNAPASQIDATDGQPLPTSAPTEQPLAKAIRTREHSKQAIIIEMLKRTEGATISQICEVTKWQAHTVRATFATAIKKKLGMTITSSKTQGGVRTYRVTA